MTRVEVCCIGSPQKAKLAIDLGASAVGLVSEMPSRPGVIPGSLIATIVEAAV
jgi:phosphoribosylanthranilate isomerase